MIQKAQNYSAYSELLSVFSITQRIQNYSAYSELLSVFRITPRIQNYSTYSELLSVFTFHEGEPKGEPGRFHILTLAGCSLKPLAF